MIGSLQVSSLHREYAAGRLRPQDVVAAVHDRIDARGDDAVWITLVGRDRALAAAADLSRRFPGPELPALFGLPFAVKDNIDVAGLPTTAACPEYAYVATSTAPAVQRALDAGAILVGKTNLDQFATGLSGTRSPYGIVRNPFDPLFIAGGSSSGSAVAVAAGLVSFAIGTDTAGSGRVPAGLTGTVGVKPSRGLVSTRGIVPACRSLDCASIFALSVADGARVLACLAGRDPADPYSRTLPAPEGSPPPVELSALRIGVPSTLGPEDFAGDGQSAALFERSVQRLGDLGAQLAAVDLGPFLAAGQLLYDGPWIAERQVGIAPFLRDHPSSLHPVTRAVLGGGAAVSGTETFRGMHALAEVASRVAPLWGQLDALMVPTIPRTPTVQQMLADPIGANSQLGRYTNFVNLLDLAALAVPAALSGQGVPVGVTFLAPAGGDGLLLAIGAAWQASVGLAVDTLGHPLDAAAPQVVPAEPAAADPASVLVAVAGAHLRGQPLHVELVRLGASLHSCAHTSAEYRLHALPATDGLPPRPGLIRVPEGGAAVEVEVYRVPVTALGRLVAATAAPLGFGQVRLADGSAVLGFLCEPAGAADAPDITHHGGWRAYLSAAQGR